MRAHWKLIKESRFEQKTAKRAKRAKRAFYYSYDIGPQSSLPFSVQSNLSFFISNKLSKFQLNQSMKYSRNGLRITFNGYLILLFMFMQNFNLKNKKWKFFIKFIYYLLLLKIVYYFRSPRKWKNPQITCTCRPRRSRDYFFRTTG